MWFGKIVVMFFVRDNFGLYIQNTESVFLVILVGVLGEIIGLAIGSVAKLKFANSLLIQLVGVLYFLSFFMIGPWRVIMPGEFWVSVIGLFLNGVLSMFLIVHLMLKIYYFSTRIYGYNIEDLLIECIAAVYIIAFSLASLSAPLFSEVFKKILAFDNTAAVIGFSGLLFMAFQFKFPRTEVRDVQVFETRPAENQDIYDENKENIALTSNRRTSDSVLPITYNNISIHQKEINDSYDFNYLSIQAGYTFEKDFASLKLEKTDNDVSWYPDKTEPLRSLLDIENTIEESKLDQVLQEIPEEDSSGEYKKKILQDEASKEIKIEENIEEPPAIEQNIEESPAIEQNIEESPAIEEKSLIEDEAIAEEQPDPEDLPEKVEIEEESYHHSKEAIHELSQIFPSNSY